MQDGLVAAPTQDNKYLITSPNMNYIPSPAWGALRVSFRADGKFGMEDPIQYPQMFDKGSAWVYLACMPRVGHRQRRLDLWVTPTVDSFDAAGTGVIGLHILKSPRLQAISDFIKQLDAEVEEFESAKAPSTHLRWLQLTLHTSFDCLSIPSTHRDIIRQLATVERFCCMVIAWLTWTRLLTNLANSAPRIPYFDLMGVFTTSATLVGELYRAGIPVWYMRLMPSITRDVVVVSDTCLQPLENIVTDAGLFSDSPLYRGPPGRAQHDAIIHYSSQAIDVERLAFPSSYTKLQPCVATSNAPPVASSSSGVPNVGTSSSVQAGPVRNKKWGRKGQQQPCELPPSLPN